jgi:hypothetical protein
MSKDCWKHGGSAAMRDSTLLVALAETKVKALNRDDGGPEVRGSAPLGALWTSPSAHARRPWPDGYGVGHFPSEVRAIRGALTTSAVAA